MSAPDNVLIVGAGLAGFQVGAGLREMGYAGRITLVGDEPFHPYQRPPLSKSFLIGTSDEMKLALRPDHYFADKKLEILTGRRVTALDCSRLLATLDDGRVLDYRHLVFATGARNRPLLVSGAELKGVHYLRTLTEARALKIALGSAKRAVVIGAGFIGLEFTAAACKLGLSVTVIELADRPMARALSPAIAAIFTREHEKSGVRFLFNVQVQRLIGAGGSVTAVETVTRGDAGSGGGAIEVTPTDLVLVGIGVLPNVEVAAHAGLTVANGIVVDEHLRTSDPNISAAGDCAAHPNPFALGGAPGGLVRLESVQNATDQARCIASRIVGQPVPYASVPWFWSDQGHLKLQIAGLTMGCDEVVMRGDAAANAVSAFCFRAGQLLGIESVNRPADHVVGKRLVHQRIPLTPSQAADEAFDLKAHTATGSKLAPKSEPELG